MLPTLPRHSEAFSLSAAVYDALYADKNYDAEIAKISPYLGTPGSGSRPRLLIDWGAGTGQFTKRLAAQGWHAIGFDYSMAMVKVAQANGIDVRPGDMAEAPMQKIAKAFAQTCMFAAFSYGAAHHHPLAILKNWHDAASMRGRLVFDFVNAAAEMRQSQEREIVDSTGRTITIQQKKRMEQPDLIDNTISYRLRGPDAKRSTRWTEQHFMRTFYAGDIRKFIARAGWSDIEILDLDPPADGSAPYYLTAVARRVIK